MSNISTLVKREFHSLFIQLVEAGVEAEDRAEANRVHSDSAHLIFRRLLFALMRYNGPCDEHKRRALLKTASYFQKHGHIHEAEYILDKLAEIKHPYLPHQQDPCLLLAQSLAKSSESARPLLTNIWQKVYGRGEVPVHLVFPPSQRAALHSNEEVALAVLSNPTNFNYPSDVLALQDLHIAAARGLTEKVKALLQAGAPIDPQDALSRTPLFLAAMHGHDEACLALVSDADLRSRDICGRTILEVAAQGGHLSTVQRLVENGAVVNPFGGSTPLHAAIEGNYINVAHYLLDSGALVGIQRIPDGKTAIDVAEARGWHCLAQLMRYKLQPFAPTMDWQAYAGSLF